MKLGAPVTAGSSSVTTPQPSPGNLQRASFVSVGPGPQGEHWNQTPWSGWYLVHFPWKYQH